MQEAEEDAEEARKEAAAAAAQAAEARQRQHSTEARLGTSLVTFAEPLPSILRHPGPNVPVEKAAAKTLAFLFKSSHGPSLIAPSPSHTDKATMCTQ